MCIRDRNLEHYGDRVEWDGAVTEVQKKLIGDPQTSGGLLLAVPPDRSAALVEALQEAGSLASSVVGTLTGVPGVRVS